MHIYLMCTGFVPGTPASVPPYPVLQHAPTHHFARTESGRTALEVLLVAGADVSKTTATGATPLAAALRKGHAAVAARLRAA